MGSVGGANRFRDTGTGISCAGACGVEFVLGGICGCVVRDPVVWFVIRAGTLADPYGDLRVCLFGGWNGICWWCQ